MAGYRYLSGLLIFIVFGCAQVGVISGGEKDTFAPKPIEAEVFPINASTNMTLKEIKIPFDEFIKLNEPAKNIQLVPPQAKILSRVKGKTLYLSWDEELEPNTTYAIYLNHAVQDLSERNDSIMQYVFSTGNELDSLSYTVSVVDAWTNTAIANALVAMYDPVTGDVMNIGLTGNSGSTSLRYLKAGDYKIIAFEDENGDLTPQPSETVGFFNDSITTIDTSFLATTPIRLFTPLSKPEILSSKFQAPSTFLLETNRPLINEKIYLDGVLQGQAAYNLVKGTSVELFVNAAEISTGTIVIHSDLLMDTTTYRVLDARRKGVIRLNPAQTNGVFAPSDSIRFLLNDVITSVDTSRFKLISLADSSTIYAPITWEGNSFSFHLNRGKTEQYSLTIATGGIQTTSGESPEYKAILVLNSPKKYGVLSLDLSYYQSDFILQVLQANQLVEERVLTPTSDRLIISELLPGEYTFKIIRDANQNGRWDVGELSSRTQPESVDIYSSPAKVRANWEVEVQLVPKTETP